MNAPRFVCNPVDVYFIFEIPAWVAGERLGGRAAPDQDIAVQVSHPDREMDGSCRWCGVRQDEVVVVDPAGRLVHH